MKTRTAAILLVVLVVVSALLQRTALAQRPVQSEKFPPGAKCLVAEHDAAKANVRKVAVAQPGVAKSEAARPEAITKEQADAIVGELKQIRQLLEKQQTQLAAAMAPRPAASPAPPEKVQMSVGNGWYAIGRDDAPVTLVEFADYQCPFCKKFHTDAYAELKKNYIDTGKVRFVSRDLPLEFHPLALKAAEATRCAGDQGKYWELRDALYSAAAPPNDEVIKKAVESLSLETQAFNTCLASDKYKSDVQKDATEAAQLQISGTPTFVLAKSSRDKLDGIRIVGAQPYVAFQTAIESFLKTEVALKN
jgi:protein-disulfide isomerase